MLTGFFMNKAVAKHLADPYNRIKYCYAFLKEDDAEMYNKAMRRIYHFVSVVSDCEAHYWNEQH